MEDPSPPWRRLSNSGRSIVLPRTSQISQPDEDEEDWLLPPRNAASHTRSKSSTAISNGLGSLRSSWSTNQASNNATKSPLSHSSPFQENQSSPLPSKQLRTEETSLSREKPLPQRSLTNPSLHRSSSNTVTTKSALNGGQSLASSNSNFSSLHSMYSPNYPNSSVSQPATTTFLSSSTSSSTSDSPQISSNNPSPPFSKVSTVPSISNSSSLSDNISFNQSTSLNQPITSEDELSDSNSDSGSETGGRRHHQIQLLGTGGTTTAAITTATLGLEDRTPAWVEMLERDKHTIRVAVHMPTPQLFDEVVKLLTSRDRKKVGKFKRRYNLLAKDVLLAFQKLAYIQEYCRFASIPQLQLWHPSSSSSYCLDLRQLILAPKACCRPKTERSTLCPRSGVVSCARCLVAIWCSESCLLASYDIHQQSCDIGYSFRQEFDL
jgi:hypothetical protein